ncbi:MAG: nicotinate phosphoribosyltransferase [Peptoniphilaceae bacterium]|nr:nicotinate phosphoribosyltransferase [Peptoniphilaceae bacterium]MDD7383261.1 nicotinate phosphoribosyltransferase [Peptoniphilaceae bacterium]MDY3737982.1 nicotinate phosphoribosyltransferase [Peptoniphilaceae bacterium]
MTGEINNNLSMLTDFYELTMGNGYLKNNMQNYEAVFDAFFRKVPDDGGFAIFSGLEQIINYIENLHFTDEDISYLKKQNVFDDEFLDYLKNFKFSGDVWAFPEGSVMFPNEPIVTIKAPIIEAQILETMILISLNFSSLIATKANRIVRAANGRSVMEFGARRAQGPDASILGARATAIAGVGITSNTLSAQKYGMKPSGTMAHSWIQAFDSEYEAFETYAKLYPDNCVLLVDTFDTLNSGLPNAIKVFDNILKPMGKVGGIRIDSGDLAYLTKESRRILDKAGYKDVKIVVSNSIDEYKIQSLLSQNAQIDSFGIGERMITSKSEPVFGGVYKLVQIEKNGDVIPKIKVSNNVEKITVPGLKKVFRLYDKKTGKAEADYLTLEDEKVDDTKPIVIFDPNYTWKMKRMENFSAREMQIKIFENGKRIYNSPDINEINAYCKKEVKSLWDEVKRFDSPHNYYVDLSQKLWNLKQGLILKAKEN